MATSAFSFSKFSGPLSSHTLNHINTLSSINDPYANILPFLLLFLKNILRHTANAHINIQTDTHSSMAGVIVGIA